MAFANNGCKVVLAASYDKLILIAEEMISVVGEVLTVQADVSNEEDCQHLISETISKFKKELMFLLIMLSMRAILEEMDLSVMKKVMDINFYGTVFALNMPRLCLQNLKVPLLVFLL